jgi:hypothetical protein
MECTEGPTTVWTGQVIVCRLSCPETQGLWGLQCTCDAAECTTVSCDVIGPQATDAWTCQVAPDPVNPGKSSVICPDTQVLQQIGDPTCPGPRVLEIIGAWSPQTGPVSETQQAPPQQPPGAAQPQMGQQPGQMEQPQPQTGVSPGP